MNRSPGTQQTRLYFAHLNAFFSEPGVVHVDSYCDLSIIFSIGEVPGRDGPETVNMSELCIAVVSVSILVLLMLLYFALCVVRKGK